MTHRKLLVRFHVRGIARLDHLSHTHGQGGGLVSERRREHRRRIRRARRGGPAPPDGQAPAQPLNAFGGVVVEAAAYESKKEGGLVLHRRAGHAHGGGGPHPGARLAVATEHKKLAMLACPLQAGAGPILVSHDIIEYLLSKEERKGSEGKGEERREGKGEGGVRCLLKRWQTG